MTAIASRMTLEEFSDLDDTDGLELVDGVVEEVCMGLESGKLAMLLAQAVDDYVTANRAGIVLPNDMGIDLRALRPNLLRKPDGMFVRRGRLPDNSLPAGWLMIAPDIAWEVVSPGDRVEALERKLIDYREAGITIVWVVYPGTRTARIERRGDSAAFIDSDGYLDGEDVLPGFRLRLGEIFERYDGQRAALNEADASAAPPA